ncbi:DUF262 domain-containing protein [Bradyrhizobium sp. BR 1433]|uniref:DUF262 domain-containing protein n=1 Tax=Bradyrhizobium sp. BR 1433 TaxID=3447967 RepID=UPI003EE61CC5
MKKTSTAPPTPSVEHLPTIFRRIRSGDYRVPPFQRDFVWEEKQVLELLESVYRGFPIGSILLWRVDRPVFKSVKKTMVGFPSTDDRYPASFVLDGVQRLTSLNGVFNRDEVSDDDRFDIYFDLESESFVHARDARRADRTLPLHSIFHPRAFLEQQKSLASLRGSDLLLERAVNLLSVFQEYMVPVVSISERNATEVVNIFERINSTGVRLGVVDFMRALTWSDEFDLTAELDDLQAELEEHGFRFEDETLLKAMGIIVGLPPLPDILLQLRDVSAKRLHDAVRTLRETLLRATHFVAREFGMASTEALPYEAQWLLMLMLVRADVNLSRITSRLRYWFTTTSFYEALKGRPDHALVRMIDELAVELREGTGIQPPSRDIRASELVTKRFLRGKATSVAYVQLLIRNGLFRQLPLASVPYEQFVPIVERSSLSEAFGRRLTFARTIANVVYVPSELMRDWEGGIESLDRLRDYDPQLLETQFLTERFLRQLRRGDVRQALLTRASAIRGAVERLEDDELAV